MYLKRFPLFEEQSGDAGTSSAAGTGVTPPGGTGAGGAGAGDDAAKVAAAAAAAAGGGDDAAKAAAAAAAAGSKPAEKSILSQGKDALDADNPLNKPAPLDDKIPEKFRVYTGEGDAKKLDVEATALKVLESQTAMEKRMGTVGAPPEKAEDYKIEFPAESKLQMADLEGPALDAFRKDAFASGLTQKQFDIAMKAHLDGLGHFVTQLGEQGAAMAKEELAKDPEWAGDKLVPQTRLAYRTFAAFATPDEMKEIDRIGNNPVFLKVLARAGKDLGEDRLNKNGSEANILPDSGLKELMREGGPYWDASHPEHQKYKDMVRRHHEGKAGSSRPIQATT